MTVDQRSLNNIPERQNEAQALERLRASRWLYSRAKVCLGSAMILALSPILLSLLTFKWESLRALAAAWGIVAAVVCIFLERLQKNLQERAALVQEQFDCDLFGLPWNTAKGKGIAVEDVAAAARAFDATKSTDTLTDWYPKVVGSPDLGVARMICQRVNCVWEKRTREKIAWACAGLLVVALVLLLVVGFVIKDFSSFVLLALAPALPSLQLVSRQFFEQRDAGRTSERLSGVADDAFAHALRGPGATSLEALSRSLQDEIYERRRSTPPVFDAIYNYCRDANEESMNRAAEELVAEAVAARPALGASRQA